MPSEATCSSASGSSRLTTRLMRFWKWTESSISSSVSGRLPERPLPVPPVAGAGAAPPRPASQASSELRRMRRCPPGVFQAWSSPRSTISCTERTAMPRRCAASVVEQVSGTVGVAFTARYFAEFSSLCATVFI